MIRIILTHGLISGVVIITGIMISMLASGGAPHSSVWLGYLIMLVGLSAILVGIKQYRDQMLGGVITFKTAALLGLGIALIASLAYVLVWEGYLFTTHYAFMDNYTAQILASKRAEGITGAAYQKAVVEMQEMSRMYDNPLYRLPMTFSEIFPVGLLVTLVSAVLLRNPRVLPAKRRAA